MALKETLFAQGAAIVGRYGPAFADSYVCPLCLNAFRFDALADGRLTVEHVPPRRLGGRGLLLTCARCNSWAGTAMDSHAASWETVSEFAGGDLVHETRGTIRLTGAP